MQGGAHDYLLKPVNLSELKGAIRKALEKQKLRMENKRVYPKNLTEGGFWGNRSVPRQDSERARLLFCSSRCLAGERTFSKSTPFRFCLL
jgi:DNA-binding NtrC family response regulator